MYAEKSESNYSKKSVIKVLNLQALSRCDCSPRMAAKPSASSSSLPKPPRSSNTPCSLSYSSLANLPRWPAIFLREIRRNVCWPQNNFGLSSNWVTVNLIINAPCVYYCYLFRAEPYMVPGTVLILSICISVDRLNFQLQFQKPEIYFQVLSYAHFCHCSTISGCGKQ